VDFRAACFCHRNVVDTGFVCSVCLSIFCEVPDDGECLTCGTKLALGKYGRKPVLQRGKILNGGGGMRG
jgi:transcription initiation factor TFIIH subunit 3